MPVVTRSQSKKQSLIQPIVEESKVEESKVEESKVEESKVEESKVEESKVEESKVEESKVEETVINIDDRITTNGYNGDEFTNWFIGESNKIMDNIEDMKKIKKRLNDVDDRILQFYIYKDVITLYQLFSENLIKFCVLNYSNMKTAKLPIIILNKNAEFVRELYNNEIHVDIHTKNELDVIQELLRLILLLESVIDKYSLVTVKINERPYFMELLSILIKEFNVTL
jgi:hypothetical protein